MKWVVKIGGGLYNAPQLPRVVRRVRDFASPVLVVPGGGPFTDQVRAAQKRWGFTDACAHAMALLGMRQYGHMLAALGGFEISEQIALPRAAAPRLWLPSEAVLAGHLAASWDVTSDSIAAWLAGAVGADQLVLVKPLPFVAANCAPEFVDAAFYDTVGTQSNLSCTVIRFEQWLAEGFVV